MALLPTAPSAPPETPDETIRRLTAELREARDEQAATAEILELINHSLGDLTPVFDAILDKAHALCGAAYGGMAVYDGEYFRAVAMRGYPDDLAETVRRPFRGNVFHQQLVRGEPFVQIPDVVAVAAELSDAPGQAIRAAGLRTTVMIPLRKDNALLGQITASRREVRPFSDREIALLQNFAAQAVIAVENARLLIETREALEQQTATAEVLQVINSSPGNLAPVFDAILDKAHALCEAPLGALVLRDGEQLRAVATRGYPEEYDALARAGFAPTELFSRLLSGERFVQDADSRATGPDDEHPMKHAAREIAGVRTVLVIPLRKDGALLGYISAQRQVVSPFTDKQIALLQNFAAQAVIAMENARLLTETREALEQQTATAEVLQVINSSPGDLAPVFDAMLERAMRLCETACGTLWTYDGESFRLVAQHAVPPEFDEFLRSAGPLRPRAGSPMRRLLDGEHVLQSDEAANPLPSSLGMRAALIKAGARTGLWVALRKDEVLLGAIYTYRHEARLFSDKQIALLQNFAAQAVVAMENARLLTETREALEQQTATAEVLQVINSSPGELAPVFDAILEKAHTLCGADHGALALYDGGDRFRAVAVPSASETFAERLREGIRVAGDPVGQPLLDGARFVHVPDQAEIAIPRHRRLPSRPAHVLSWPYRSAKTTCCMAQSQLFGKRCGRLPTNRSRCSKTSRRRR